jgi:hypothetical protein
MQADWELKLRVILQGRSASEADVDFWLSRLEGAPDDICENILDLFSAFPEEIGWLKDVQIRKEKALADHDQNAWEEILKEEEAHLGTLKADSKEQ